MNIIVTKDKLIRLTQYSSQSTYNLTDIDFYISKDLIFNDLSIGVRPMDSLSTYILELVESSSVKNYRVYKIKYPKKISLIERDYSITLNINNEKIECLTSKFFATK